MGRRQRLLLALSAALPLVAACVGEPPDVAAPTWEADVAPRLARSCLSCHATADGGRPALGTLAEARRAGTRMVFAVEGGLMPPGGLERGGSCQTFLGPAPFTAEDADVLRAWVDAGMPAGAATGRAAEAPGPSAPSEVLADRVVDLELPLSLEATDAHRCFLVDPGPETPRQLAGVAVEGAGVVHHVMLFTLPAGSATAARALDAADAAPGWSCPATPGVPSALVLAWVPGQEVAAFPAGAAAALPPGPLVVQVHQHGATGAPSARLSLLLVDDAPRAVRMLPVADSGFSLPPGLPSVTRTRTTPAPFADDVLVLGVMPHLHAAGRAVALSVEDGPCLADAPRFDFGWQELAFYEAPVRVEAGARLSLSCTWDTSDRTGPVPWGESSDDEMCTVFLFVTDP